MAIDADLNAGLISQDEALERRERVSRESDFYGAMDGASKFVRGDAVAGILILFINILGGFAIGTLQHGLDAGQAAENYVLLTIGDGLVAQIPSMLLSTATAIIVTRVSGEQDMSAEVSRQLTSNPKVLFVASGIIGVMGLVPGMPNLVFLSIATLLGLSGYQKTVADRVPEVVEASEPLPSSNVNPELSWDDVSTLDSIGLEVGYRLIPLVDVSQGGDLLSRIKGVRKKLSQDLGFLVDSVHIRDNLDLGPNVYRLTIHGVVMGEAELLPDRELAINPGQVFGEVDGIPAKDPSFGLDALWIDPSNRESAQTAGYTVVDCSTVVATHLSQILKNNAAKLVGQDDVQQLLDRLKQNSPKLVENLVPGVMSLADVTRVIHSLLDEGVPIRDMRTIAETLSLQRGSEKSPDEMVSQVRVALGPSIFQSVTGQAHELPVMVLDPQLEQIMGNAIQNNNGVIEPNLLDTVVTGISDGSGKMEAEGASPVLLVSGAIRGFLARLLRGRMANFYILAYDEIPADKNIRVVTTVGKQSS
jgi:flagellar biosynthesis protein FlhA